MTASDDLAGILGIFSQLRMCRWRTPVAWSAAVSHCPRPSNFGPHRTKCVCKPVGSITGGHTRLTRASRHGLARPANCVAHAQRLALAQKVRHSLSPCPRGMRSPRRTELLALSVPHAGGCRETILPVGNALRHVGRTRVPRGPEQTSAEACQVAARAGGCQTGSTPGHPCLRWPKKTRPREARHRRVPRSHLTTRERREFGEWMPTIAGLHHLPSLRPPSRPSLHPSLLCPFPTLALPLLAHPPPCDGWIQGSEQASRPLTARPTSAPGWAKLARPLWGWQAHSPCNFHVLATAVPRSRARSRGSLARLHAYNEAKPPGELRLRQQGCVVFQRLPHRANTPAKGRDNHSSQGEPSPHGSSYANVDPAPRPALLQIARENEQKIVGAPAAMPKAEIFHSTCRMPFRLGGEETRGLLARAHHRRHAAAQRCSPGRSTSTSRGPRACVLDRHALGLVPKKGSPFFEQGLAKCAAQHFHDVLEQLLAGRGLGRHAAAGKQPLQANPFGACKQLGPLSKGRGHREPKRPST